MGGWGRFSIAQRKGSGRGRCAAKGRARLRLRTATLDDAMAAAAPARCSGGGRACLSRRAWLSRQTHLPSPPLHRPPPPRATGAFGCPPREGWACVLPTRTQHRRGFTDTANTVSLICMIRRGSHAGAASAAADDDAFPPLPPVCGPRSGATRGWRLQHGPTAVCSERVGLWWEAAGFTVATVAAATGPPGQCPQKSRCLTAWQFGRTADGGFLWGLGASG